MERNVRFFGEQFETIILEIQTKYLTIKTYEMKWFSETKNRIT